MGKLREKEESRSVMTWSQNLISKLPPLDCFLLRKKKKLGLFKPLLFLVSALDF